MRRSYYSTKTSIDVHTDKIPLHETNQKFIFFCRREEKKTKLKKRRMCLHSLQI